MIDTELTAIKVVARFTRYSSSTKNRCCGM